MFRYGTIRNKVSFLILSVLVGCTSSKVDHITLTPRSFSDFSLWEKDKKKEALHAFMQSCTRIKWKKPNYKYTLAEAGRVKDWQAICKQIPKIKKITNKSAQTFFETYFKPYEINQKTPGLFTGYYEAQMRGSYKNEGPYQFPLWQKPKDLVRVKLGQFDPSLEGKQIVGRLKKDRLIPYDDRTSIDKGSLWGRAQPLIWVEDPIDGFFMEIQGSGQIKLPNGKTARLGYAAQNGHKYVPIGRVMKKRGQLQSPISMKKIRQWLNDHPWEEQTTLNENPSKIFFTKVKKGPIGAFNVPLTPRRSLAVDPKYIPLGIPLWLETKNHHRIVVAQDTGGAIKGIMRGDLFWGNGERAEHGAGHMQEAGQYFLLLPKNVTR